MQSIQFRTELDGIGVELKLVPNEAKQCLELHCFVPENERITEKPINSINWEEWKILGEIKLKHLITICNREKLSCKYGHPIEVAKRKKGKK